MCVQVYMIILLCAGMHLHVRILARGTYMYHDLWHAGLTITEAFIPPEGYLQYGVDGIPIRK